jgi:hypothetical protein
MRYLTRVRRILIGLLALGALLIGLQAGTAEAAQPRTLWVEPLNFVPWTDTAQFTFNGPNLYGTELYAPAAMPAGKKISGITIYYLDNSAGDLCVTLSVHPVGAVNWLPMGAACSSGEQPQASSSQTVFPTVYKLRQGDIPFLHASFGAYDPNLLLLSVGVQYK